MAEIGGQYRHPWPNVEAAEMPIEQGVHGEAVAVMGNSPLAALGGRWGYAPCRVVVPGEGRVGRLFVRIILAAGVTAQRVEPADSDGAG